MTAADFWEGLYADGRSRWSGNANELLIAQVADLRPGSALDLGCGQGGDAIWLASQGWRVTAVDIARSALAYAVQQAAAAGVADRISWERHDLDESFPLGQFDLVTASYLQSPVELGRIAILRAAAAAVRPGGTLVVVGHAGPPSWDSHGHGAGLPAASEVLASLALDRGWDVEQCADIERTAAAPDGSPGTRPDSVVSARRRIDRPTHAPRHEPRGQ